MALVFISHSSLDNENIEIIIETIRANNIDSIFLDFDDSNGIDVGEEWEEKIYSEIQRSHVMLLLLSPAWISSKWCFAEYRLARSLGKEIIPLIIEHGDYGEIDKWIENNIQKSDYSKDKKVLTRVISRIRNVSMETQKGFEWDKNRSPYPGLIAFEEEDAPVFFGRENEVKSIIERLNSMQYNKNIRLLNIVAASGLGKSSVLKAGVLPRLKLSYSSQWEVLEVLRPTRRPLYEFTKLIVKHLGKEEEYKALYEGFKSDEYKGFIDDILTEVEFLSVKKKFILLSIDQVEEFYSIADTEEKKLFFRMLDYCLTEKENICFIWTLRSDFLKESQVDASTNIIHRYEEIYSLSSISKDAVGAIIKEPAYIAGVNMEEELLSSIKDDMQSVDALPILALCLNDLYSCYAKNGTLRLVDYQHLAKSTNSNPMENIIKQKADEAIGQFRNNQKIMKGLKEAFIPHLVRINLHGQYVQRDAFLSDLPDVSHEAIESLVCARLLIKKNVKNKVKIEISHEALIRKWSLLQEWLKDEHEFLIAKARLEVALSEWKKAKKTNGALLGGLQLEKALLWKDRLNSNEEIHYINESFAYASQKKRKNKERYVAGFIAILLLLFSSLYHWNQSTIYLKDTQKVLEESTIKQAIFYRDYLNEPLKAKLLFAKLLSQNENSTRLKVLYTSINNHLSLIDIQEHEDKYNGVKQSKINRANLLVWTLDNKVELWNSKKRIKLCWFEHSKNVNGAMFNKNETKILSWAEDGRVKLFSRKENRVEKEFKHHGNIIGAMFSLDEKKLLSWAGKSVKVWSMKNDSVKTFTHTENVTGAVLSKQNDFLFTWNAKSIKVWNMKNNDVLEFKHDALVRGIILNKNENKILSWADDHTVRLWSIDSVKQLRLFRHKSKVNAAIFDNNESRVLSWSEGNSLRLWSIIKNKQIHHYQQNVPVIGAKFYRDEKEILSWGGDEEIQMGEVKLWDVQTAKNLFSIVHDSKVYLALLDTKHNTLQSWSSNWDTKVAEIRTWKIERAAKFRTKLTNQFSILKKSKELVWENEKELKVYDESGTLLHKFKHYLKINGAIFSQDKKKILTWSEDSTIKLWSKESGELLMLLKHDDGIKGAMFNKDATLILSWSKNEIRLWDMNRNMLCSILRKDFKRATLNKEENKILILNNDDVIRAYGLYDKNDLEKKNYSLEVAVKNGISLTNSDEIIVLNKEGWEKKKEKSKKEK